MLRSSLSRWISFHDQPPSPKAKWRVPSGAYSPSYCCMPLLKVLILFHTIRRKDKTTCLPPVSKSRCIIGVRNPILSTALGPRRYTRSNSRNWRTEFLNCQYIGSTQGVLARKNMRLSWGKSTLRSLLVLNCTMEPDLLNRTGILPSIDASAEII